MQISASISLVTLGNTELCCCAIFISLLYMKVASARLIINPYRLAPLFVLNMPSKTFTPPYHLDSDLLTFPDVWDHAAEHSPDHPVFTYHDGDACDGERIITWGRATQAMHSAGRTVLQAFENGGGIEQDGNGDLPVIAILAVSGKWRVFSQCHRPHT